MSTQKVVIPKWMINPEEVTIIEIPAELKAVDTVIIKPKMLANVNNSMESAEPNILQQRHSRAEKLDKYNYIESVCIRSIPEWNEYFARAIKKRRASELQNELTEEDTSEEEENVDEAEEDNIESEELLEGDHKHDYEYTHNTYHPDNHLFNEVVHTRKFEEDSDNRPQPQESPRQMLMRSPYSSVNKATHNVRDTKVKNKKIEHVADLLDLVEKFEYSKIHRDLKEFQKARRKLVFSTTKLSTTPCFTISPK